MDVRAAHAGQEEKPDAGYFGLLRRNPKSFLKLILIGFSLVALPLIVALINSAVSIDQLANQSRKAVYQAAQIAHGSRVLADEITAMERSVRQTVILNDATLLEGYFRAHAKFADAAAMLEKLSLNADQQQSLGRLQQSEQRIFQQVSASGQTPDGLHDLVGDFGPLLDAARLYSTAGYALIEHEVDAMQSMAGHARAVVGWQLLALIPFAILLASGFSVLITRPIRQIDDAIRRMGQGQLSQVVQVEGPEDLKYLGDRLDWMRRRLLGLEEQKTQFLQHVSHELKTPLTALREGSDLLAEGIVGELNPKQQQVANILHTNSVQLQKRIEDLLSFSALQYEKSALNKTTVKLAELLDAVLQDQQLAIMNKALQVDLAIPDLTLVCDEQKIKTVVDNLLSNAVKFSPHGGLIRIAAQQLGDAVQLDVTDAGPGIDEADRERLFEPFFQGRRAPDGPTQGTGLGLSISREYVLAHGGSIALLPAGEGAHFQLNLPVRDIKGEV
ncbi:sensor histidine kinase [Sulfuriferula thiophila]|uniref:sensor histidine kinase n=1 Tax=Sulfuriferula thiophila TaxID=1781211 RepID=UPI000F606912|nr:ATP-binding protein [Sulfuriferula thiophila]